MDKKIFYVFSVILAINCCDFIVAAEEASDFSLTLCDGDTKRATSLDADAKAAHDDSTSNVAELARVRRELSGIEEELEWCAEESEAAQRYRRQKKALEMQVLELRLAVTQEAQGDLLTETERQFQRIDQRMDEFEQTQLASGNTLVALRKQVNDAPRRFDAMHADCMIMFEAIKAKVEGLQRSHDETLEGIAAERRAVQANNESLRSRLKKAERFVQANRHAMQLISGLRQEMIALKKVAGIEHNPLKPFYHDLGDNKERNGHRKNQAKKEDKPKYKLYGKDGDQLANSNLEKIQEIAKQMNCDLESYNGGYKLIDRGHDRSGSTVGMDFEPTPQPDKAASAAAPGGITHIDSIKEEENANGARENQNGEEADEDSSGKDVGDLSSQEGDEQFIGGGRENNGTQRLSHSSNGNDSFMSESPHDLGFVFPVQGHVAQSSSKPDSRKSASSTLASEVD